MEASKYQKAVCKLGELLKGKFEWIQEHTEAIEELKNVLSSDTVQADTVLQPPSRTRTPRGRVSDGTGSHSHAEEAWRTSAASCAVC